MRRLVTILTLLAALGVGAASCSSDDISGLTKSSSKKKTAKTKGAGGSGSIGDDDDSSASTRTIDNSGQLQVKDVVLLKNSIKSCMGDGMTTIHTGMLLPPVTAAAPDVPAPDAKLALTQDDQKFAFLLPTEANKDGADIVDSEKGNLVDLSASSRTSVASDSLTDTYLRSLETIANVVAFNCDASKKECSCGTKELARDMLTRCLPSLDPKTKEMDEAATMLGNVCKKGDAGMRKAIASMIASYAFAAAR